MFWILTLLCIASIPLQAMEKAGNKGVEAAIQDSLEQRVVEEWLRKARIGSREAIELLSYHFIDKYVSTPNEHTWQEAANWTKKAATEFEDPEIQHNYGLLCQKKSATEESAARRQELIIESIDSYRKAAQNNWLDAQNNLAMFLLELSESKQGDERTAMRDEAKLWLEKAAERGLKIACFNLGATFYAKEGSTKDDKQERKHYFAIAISWMERAEISEVNDFIELALLYLKMSSYDDYALYIEKAKSCMKKILELSRQTLKAPDRLDQLCYQMGMHLINKEQEDKAVPFLRKAIKTGVVGAYYNAAFACHKMYLKSKRLHERKKWLAKAIVYYEQAREHNKADNNIISECSFSLGSLYHIQRDEETDAVKKERLQKQAIKYFEEAAALGHAGANYNMAVHYTELIKYKLLSSRLLKEDEVVNMLRFFKVAIIAGHEAALVELRDLKTSIQTKCGNEVPAVTMIERILSMAPQKDSQATVCVACAKPSEFVCGRCKASFYCSAACQKSHWAQHKPVCKSPNNIS